MKYIRQLRWFLAGGLLTAAATVVLISNTSQHLHSCSTITEPSRLPKGISGLAQQTQIMVPLVACEPIDVMVVVPILATALVLLLPDYGEVGIGGIGLKRLEQRLADQVQRVTQQVRDSLAQATGINKDVEAGTVQKGAIRNVELRVRTVQEILLRALLADPATQRDALYAAGVEWGKGWSEDFVEIEQGVDVSSAEGVKAILSDWTYYDATAGLGRIEFEFGADHLPTQVTVRNGFLSIERDEADLRNLFAGYLAGSLDGLLAAREVSFDVRLEDKAVDRDVYVVAVASSGNAKV